MATTREAVDGEALHAIDEDLDAGTLDAERSARLSPKRSRCSRQTGQTPDDASHEFAEHADG